jgi:hypothetical protein
MNNSAVRAMGVHRSSGSLPVRPIGPARSSQQSTSYTRSTVFLRCIHVDKSVIRRSERRRKLPKTLMDELSTCCQANGINRMQLLYTEPARIYIPTAITFRVLTRIRLLVSTSPLARPDQQVDIWNLICYWGPDFSSRSGL